MAEHSLITLTNTAATKLTGNGIHSGMDITLQNVNTSGFVYVGGAGVTTSNYGYRISPENAISFELPGQESLYAISDVSGALLAVMKTKLEKGS